MIPEAEKAQRRCRDGLRGCTSLVLGRSGCTGLTPRDHGQGLPGEQDADPAFGRSCEASDNKQSHAFLFASRTWLWWYLVRASSSLRGEALAASGIISPTYLPPCKSSGLMLDDLRRLCLGGGTVKQGNHDFVSLRAPRSGNTR